MKEEMVFKNVNDLSKIENYLEKKVQAADKIVQMVNQDNTNLLKKIFKEKIPDVGELSEDEYLYYVMAKKITLMKKYLEDYTKLSFELVNMIKDLCGLAETLFCEEER